MFFSKPHMEWEPIHLGRLREDMSQFYLQSQKLLKRVTFGHHQPDLFLWGLFQWLACVEIDLESNNDHNLTIKTPLYENRMQIS